MPDAPRRRYRSTLLFGMKAAVNHAMSSRLFYHGTNTEVMIGDRIMIKKWFWRRRFGHVCYIPGISRPHPELEYEDVKQWAFQTDDGTVYAMVYAPEHRAGQPRKKLVFLERTDSPALAPDYPLM